MALLSLLVSSSVLWRNRKSLDVARARGLVLASIPGIPIGIYFLKNLPASWIHFSLGSMLIGFAIWSLFFQERTPPIESSSPSPPSDSLDTRRKSKFAIWITGFSSGLLGGAYNTSGPPLVLYVSLQRLQPAEFKSVLSAYFICEASLLLLFHSIYGLMTREVFTNFLRLAPALIVGMVGGYFVELILKPAHFARMVLVLLALLGIKLIVL